MNPLVAAKPFRSLLKALATASASLLCLISPVFAAGSNSVTFAWDPNPETNIAGYRLKYGTTSGVYPNTVEAGTSTTATANGLNQGTTYYFVVLAYNTSGQTSPTSSQVSYTVPGTPNTAPSADAFAITVAEDGQTAATLSGSDAEGDVLAFSIVTAPAKGTFTGTVPNLTYRPNANASGSDSFTYRTHDGALDSTVATVSVTITPVNDAPLAGAVTLTVAEEGQAAANLLGSDVDGDTLSYTIVTAPTKGTLTGTAPSLTYRPAANATGSDSFTYRVNDGTVNSANATVSITITAANDVPVATPRTATTNEDTAVGITLAGTDVEGSSLTYSIVTAPSKGTLSGSPPNVSYTPSANANGADSFTFRVNDGTTNSAAATVGITVTPVNDAPVATSRTATTIRNTVVAVTLSGSDVEGSPLTYAVLTSPVSGVLTGTAPNLSYTPNTGFSGNDSFTFRVNDGTVNSATATVSITVNTGNRAPVAHPKSLATLKNMAVDVVLSGTDPDANAITYRIVSQPAEGGTLTGTPPNVRYTPAARWTGNDRFTYVTNDGTADSAPATVSVAVKSANTKPVATPRSATANQNATTPIVVAGTDADGEALTFRIVAQPANGTVTGAGPTFTYTPAPGFRGQDRFTFAAHDGIALSAAAAVTINVVNPNNRAPVAGPINLSIPAKKAAPVTLGGTDADGDPLTFRIVTQPATGKVSGKAPRLKYKPAATFVGTVTFTYVANDGILDSAPATVTLTVAAPVTTARAIGKAKTAATAAAGELPMPTLDLRPDPARPGILMLEVAGTPGDLYTLEFSTDLGSWSDSGQVLMDDNGGLTVERAIPAGSARGFYRLRTP